MTLDLSINAFIYWLNKHEEIAGQDHLYFNVQGEDLCAQMVLTAQEWHKLQPVITAKAVSYRGVQFTDLRYEIKSEASSTQFLFMDFGSIID